MDLTDWAADIAHQAITERSCYQHIDELAPLLALLADKHPPALVLEIGAGVGGSAWAWAQLPTVTEVISITLPDPGRVWTCAPHDKAHRVIPGDSTHGDTFHQLEQYLAGRRPDFLFIDGDHAYKTAWSDWVMYVPLVSPEGLVALHDIRPEPRYPGFEVHQLWAEIEPRCVTEALIGEGDHIGMGTGIVYSWPHGW